VGSAEPLSPDLARLTARMREEPYASAVKVAWRATDVHQVLARFVAGPAVARDFARSGAIRNTDDRNRVEFSFARTVSAKAFEIEHLRERADRLGASRLPMAASIGIVCADIVSTPTPSRTDRPPCPTVLSAEQRSACRSPDPSCAGRPAWSRSVIPESGGTPTGLIESALLGRGAGRGREPDAARPIVALGGFMPAEADAAAARLALRQGRPDVAAEALISAFSRYRTDPWPDTRSWGAHLSLAEEIVTKERRTAPALFETLGLPFAVRALEQGRVTTRLRIASLARLGRPVRRGTRTPRAACAVAEGRPRVSRRVLPPAR
jgi:hypothetical protein